VLRPPDTLLVIDLASCGRLFKKGHAILKKKANSVEFSPQMNNTDRVAAVTGEFNKFMPVKNVAVSA
jgi:hypothetical protein